MDPRITSHGVSRKTTWVLSQTACCSFSVCPLCPAVKQESICSLHVANVSGSEPPGAGRPGPEVATAEDALESGGELCG